MPLTQPSIAGKKTCKDCFEYQVERSCRAGDQCPFYHRDLAPDICINFLFGTCKRQGGDRCKRVHVRESHLPFPPTSEVARLRSLLKKTPITDLPQEKSIKLQTSVSVQKLSREQSSANKLLQLPISERMLPATAASELSLPGQVRNVKLLLGGRRLIQVKLLGVGEDNMLYVRPADVVEEALESSEKLNSFYCSSQTGREMIPVSNCQAGQLCAVLCGQAWYRAAVLREEEQAVLVLLLDKGVNVSVPLCQLYKLDHQFQCGPSWSIPCHLARITNCRPDMVTKINDLMAEFESPQMMVLGSPIKKKQDQCSLPVDIRWNQLEVPDDPFLPLETKECSLSAILVEYGMAEWTMKEDVEEDSNSENEQEETNNLIVTQFDLVRPMEENRKFRWLDPELPSCRQFEARGTFVDDSGQIYLQLHEQRETIRLVRRILQEKFSCSEPDCDPASWRRMEECVVKWRDGKWYRARFIDYVGGDQVLGEAVVLLVDFGDTYLVLLEHLRRTLFCQNIPILSIRTTLHNVTPLAQQEWSTISLDFLQEKIHYSKLECNEILRVAVQTDLVDVQPLPVSIKLCPPADLGSYGEYAPPWVDLATLLVIRQEAEMVQPPLVLSKQMKLRREDLNFGVKFVPSGYYKDSELYSRLGLTFPCLEWERVGVWVGDFVDVKIMDIESYNCVYVQLCVGDETGYLAQLQGRYMEMASMVMGPVTRPGVGQAIGAWWEGEGWCRAVVREKGSMGRELFVEFVDFGTKDWVTWDLVRQVPEEWLSLPPLAVRLELGVELGEARDEAEVCELVWENLVKVERMMVRVDMLSDKGKLIGQLLEPHTFQPVYQELIQQGHITMIKSELPC